MKTAILFDMDGVTLNTEPLYTQAEIRLFSDYDITINKDDTSRFKGCSEEDFYKLSMQYYNINENMDIFIKKGRSYVKEAFQNQVSYMPGFTSLITRIKKNHLTGLVTASPRKHLNWIRTIINLDYYFDSIISGQDTLHNKPSPDPYLKMMQILNVPPNNCIIIEDSIPGITSALESGATVIALEGTAPKEQLAIAHHVVASLAELTNDYIKNLL